MSDYSDLLENPLWLNKRKNILERDDNKCTVCGSKKNLQVHHTFYYKDQIAPWKYPDDSLLTLCKGCHQNWHEHSEIEIKELVIIKKKKKKVKRNITPKKKKIPFRGKHRPKVCLAILQSKTPRYKSRIS